MGKSHSQWVFSSIELSLSFLTCKSYTAIALVSQDDGNIHSLNAQRRAHLSGWGKGSLATSILGSRAATAPGELSLQDTSLGLGSELSPNHQLVRFRPRDLRHLHPEYRWAGDFPEAWQELWFSAFPVKWAKAFF